jgi:hypothetical protein
VPEKLTSRESENADKTKEQAMNNKLLFVPLVMFSMRFRKHVPIVLVALAMIALTAGSASADIVLNFLELPNEGGIHLTGTAFDGTAIDVTLLGSEMFRVSAPGCTAIPGCNPNFTTNQIGTGSEFLVNILESAAGGPLSDQIHVHRLTSAAGSEVIDFISDDGTQFQMAGPNAIVTTLVETGGLQSGLTYTSDAGTPVHISFTSEVSEVPEPETLPLLGLALAGVFGAQIALGRKSR